MDLLLALGISIGVLIAGWTTLRWDPVHSPCGPGS